MSLELNTKSIQEWFENAYDNVKSLVVAHPEASASTTSGIVFILLLLILYRSHKNAIHVTLTKHSSDQSACYTVTHQGSELMRAEVTLTTVKNETAQMSHGVLTPDSQEGQPTKFEYVNWNARRAGGFIENFLRHVASREDLLRDKQSTSDAKNDLAGIATKDLKHLTDGTNNYTLALTATFPDGHTAILTWAQGSPSPGVTVNSPMTESQPT